MSRHGIHGLMDASISRGRFTSPLRYECLSQHWFASLSHIRGVLDTGRDAYLHPAATAARDYVPQIEYAARRRPLTGDLAQPQPSIWNQLTNSGAECC